MAGRLYEFRRREDQFVRRRRAITMTPRPAVNAHNANVPPPSFVGPVVGNELVVDVVVVVVVGNELVVDVVVVVVVVPA
jgi:hypothetical protein